MSETKEQTVLERLRGYHMDVPVEVEVEFGEGRFVRCPVIWVDTVYSNYPGSGGAVKVVLRTPRITCRDDSTSVAFIKGSE